MPLSPFSTPDAIGSGTHLIGLLDELAAGLGAMKAYAAAALRRAVPGGVVLDVGCGTGPDLALLAAAGLRPIGLDRSATLLAEAAARLGAPLLRADGDAIPLATASVDGCRIERVLQHVASPAGVLAEVGRVVRPGGAIAVFEPDWTTITFSSDLPDGDHVDLLFRRARNPTIGADLPRLVTEAGFCVDDVVTEASRTDRIAFVPWDVDAVIAGAVERDAISKERGAAWLEEQHARAAAGTFEARWSKVLVVATRR